MVHFPSTFLHWCRQIKRAQSARGRIQTTVSGVPAFTCRQFEPSSHESSPTSSKTTHGGAGGHQNGVPLFGWDSRKDARKHVWGKNLETRLSPNATAMATSQNRPHPGLLTQDPSKPTAKTGPVQTHHGDLRQPTKRPADQSKAHVVAHSANHTR